MAADYVSCVCVCVSNDDIGSNLGTQELSHSVSTHLEMSLHGYANNAIFIIKGCNFQFHLGQAGAPL